jgi:hypothetical protein
MDAPVLIHVNLAPVSVAIFKCHLDAGEGLRPAPPDFGPTVLHPIRQQDFCAVLLPGDWIQDRLSAARG